MAGESDSDLACSRRVADWLPAGALAGVPLDIQLQPGAASRARLFAPSGECGECIRPRAGGTTHSAARSCLVYIGALVVARRSVLRSSAGLGGGIVWEAATILTRFLVQSGAPYLPGGEGTGRCSHVLELGSGTGACGLVAAGCRYCARSPLHGHAWDMCNAQPPNMYMYKHASRHTHTHPPACVRLRARDTTHWQPCRPTRG